MKKDELYYLLINATTAKKKLKISMATLAHILGVSVKSLESWFAHSRRPSELNMYKLHWFVYLVLDLDVSLDMLLHQYNIAGMDLSSDPDGICFHHEPWNVNSSSSTFSCPGFNECNSLISTKFEKDTDDFIKYCNALDNFEKPDIKPLDGRIIIDNLYDSDVDYSDFTISSLIADANYRVFMDDPGVCFFIEQELDLSACTCQEAIRRVKILKELCQMVIENNEDILDCCEEDFNYAYSNVKDYDSFVKLLETFTSLSDLDARFDVYNMHLAMKLSSYTNPESKAVSTMVVKNITTYKDCLVIKANDGTIVEIPVDSSFKITASSSFKSPLYDFMIYSGNNYYTFSIELR